MSELSRILDALCHVELALEGAARDLQVQFEQAPELTSGATREADAARHCLAAYARLQRALSPLGEALGHLHHAAQMEERDPSSAAGQGQA